MPRTRSKAAPGNTRMEDIARIAGVSKMTVSRVLRHPERVADATRRRVQAVMRKADFVPNRVASNLALRRSQVVAIVIPIINPVFADTVRGMTGVLRERGYELLLGITDYSLAVEESAVAAFLGRRVDGIVVTGITHTKRTRDMLKRAAIPVIEMWNITRDPIDVCVGVSHYRASRQMVKYLHSRGYRRIGYLGGDIRGNDRTAGRQRGYVDAMRDLGLHCDKRRIVHRGFHFSEGAGGLAAILEAHGGQLDAVFAGSDMLAAGALFECQRRGIRVPGDLAIAGFDDAELAGSTVPGITTIRVPRFEIGRAAAEILLQRFEGRYAGPRSVDLGFELVIRQTT